MKTCGFDFEMADRSWKDIGKTVNSFKDPKE